MTGDTASPDTAPALERDLDIGLSVAAEVNRVVVAMDTKAGFLLATQGVVLAATASALRPGAEMSTARGGGIAVLLLAVGAMALVLAVLWPRTHGPAPRWVTFAGFASGAAVPARPNAAVLADQAWLQVSSLAEIARRKLRWFRAALIVASAELAGFVLWLTLGADLASTT
ncbi:hypothetical protein WIS52_18590 [Pseudonocardia nematodicida]|uniref:Pycsar effector protein domain-containing protein n=1 Tax=Pseudonocardia nematodicida TaxID=1206997 RepID=A0ABV1KFX2_9PSEU